LGDDRATAISNMHKKFVKITRTGVVWEISSRTDKYTDTTHTYRRSSQYFAPLTWGEVMNLRCDVTQQIAIWKVLYTLTVLTIVGRKFLNLPTDLHVYSDPPA